MHKLVLLCRELKGGMQGTYGPDKAMEFVQLFETFLDTGLISFEGACHDRGIELMSLYSRADQEAMIFFSKLADSEIYQAAQGIGYIALHFLRWLPEYPESPFSILNNNSLIAKMGQQINHEKRISFSPLVDRLSELVRKAMTREGLIDIGSDACAVQQAKPDFSAGAVGLQFELETHKGMFGWEEDLGSIGGDDQDSHGVKAIAEISPDIHARGVGPVDIIEKEQERAEVRDLA